MPTNGVGGSPIHNRAETGNWGHNNLFTSVGAEKKAPIFSFSVV